MAVAIIGRVTEPQSSRAQWAAVLGAVAYLLVGWCGLLVPSLIRSIETAYSQSDAGIGGYYLVAALAYAAGSLAGGLLTERLGRRSVLASASALLAVGLVLLAIAPLWGVFVLASIPMGLGVGALDGGVNGLFLDVFRSGRGRAMNLLHMCFSLGALLAPLALGPWVEAGQAWQASLSASGAVALLLGAAFLTVRMPDGRHSRGQPDPQTGAEPPESRLPRLPLPLLLLCLAIGAYIASEVGVSDWMVRFLEAAPLSLATSALALYWAGITLGRLVSARLADRFDHRLYAMAAATAMSVALVGAILAPTVELSIGLFGLAGLAAGPVAPMIMAVGGDRYPGRSAAVGGSLVSAATVGSIGLPSLIGVLSVVCGLTLAMFATVAFGLACSAALLLAGRTRAEQGVATAG